MTSNLPQQIRLLTPANWSDYELLDSGNGTKLERFGRYRVVRPDAQVLWSPRLPAAEWVQAQAVYEEAPGKHGEWRVRQPVPERWALEYDGLRFWARLTPFGHMGVFPEQAAHWVWIRERVQAAGRPLKVLNLFGYTGIASLAAARAGAQVCHLDASKAAINWVSENQQLSKLADRPIRWILDDALKFVKREARRQSCYDGVIMDPPKFGRGPKGEVWRFEDTFVTLLHACREILSPSPAFLLLTTYAQAISSVSIGNAVADLLRSFDGETECGELALRETGAGRYLSTSVYARWWRP
jgi:23S rRNA (cytosine1962-C5)-methyltransferase